MNLPQKYMHEGDHHGGDTIVTVRTRSGMLMTVNVDAGKRVYAREMEEVRYIKAGNARTGVTGNTYMLGILYSSEKPIIKDIIKNFPIFYVYREAGCSYWSNEDNRQRLFQKSVLIKSKGGNTEVLGTKFFQNNVLIKKQCLDFHNIKVAEGFEWLSLEGAFSDIELVFGDESIKTHKIILCGASAYFRAMFLGSMAEANAPRVSIDYDYVVFRALIDLVYGKELKQIVKEYAENPCDCISVSAVLDALKDAATYFQFDHVLQVLKNNSA